MNITVRKATQEDAAIVALIARITFREAFRHIWTNDTVLKNYLSSTFSVSKIQNSIQNENNVFWVAFADDLPVAYAKLKKYCPYENLQTQSQPNCKKFMS